MAALAGLLLCVCLLVATRAEAARTIQTVSPNPAAPGATVEVRGTGFGSTQKRVIYGASGSTRTAGDFAVSHWDASLVRCTVPRALAAGRYWLALASAGGNIESNRFEPFTVSGPGGAGAGGPAPGSPGPAAIQGHLAGTAAERATRGRGRVGELSHVDLAIVGVEPSSGSVVVADDGMVSMTVLVRNRGTGLGTFLLVGGPPDSNCPVYDTGQLWGPGRVGVRLPCEGGFMGETLTVRPGQTVRVPARPTARYHTDYRHNFHMRFALADPGTSIPGRVPSGIKSYVDTDNANNAMDVQYTLIPVSYEVEATLTELRINDDCDLYGDGDWIVAFIIRARDTAGEEIRTGVGWPSGEGIARVRNGDDLRPDVQATLRGVSGRREIYIETYAIDCDANNSSLETGAHYNGSAEFCQLAGKCRCTELNPASFRGGGVHTFAGVARARLITLDWQDRHHEAYSAQAQGGECGGGFNAHFRVLATPQY